MRHAFFTYGNWAKSTELALFASVPKVAIAYRIPLVWWGENPAYLLGETGVLGENPFDANQARNSNTLSGGDPSWLVSADTAERHLIWYRYPKETEFDRAGLRLVYMDYFMDEFSALANGNYAALRGLDIRSPNPSVSDDFYGTSFLDEDFINVNMLLRYLKFGFGIASDLVTAEVRRGRMDRDEAISVAQRYDGNFDLVVLEKFCNYLEISLNDFWETVDRFVNRDLFEKVGVASYRPKFKVGVGL